LFEKISGVKEPNVLFYTALKRKEQGLKAQSGQQSFHSKLQLNPNLKIVLGKLQNVANSKKDLNLVVNSLNFCLNCKKKLFHVINFL
jgi:hypothetical protein